MELRNDISASVRLRTMSLVAPLPERIIYLGFIAWNSSESKDNLNPLIEADDDDSSELWQVLAHDFPNFLDVFLTFDSMNESD